ncbi:coenzyme Q-binding protein COQ10 homolog, mitochondrial [Paralichthys olivaceus]|uniref:coenzyme Q-binding protein COQ10 homolog, mitochondrial n=1 Tax=Paralichthys olivaceus TaxID=8255 RepID=UPI00097D1ABB|nr:PREDICTED: coenzyme Q-binding protein COQ10 homolog, mitochondrial-like [Paralichthys olivaceus]
MTNKTTPLLLKTLLELREAQATKVLRGNTRRANFRHLGSCGALAARRTSLPLCPATSISIPSRSFINLVVPISTRRMEYTECRTLGYTPEQMFNVVARVDQYQHFVPWCKKSRIMKGRDGGVRAELEIGFPPIVDRYTSEVTVIPNHQVRAVCTDGSLFSHLETVWRFAPGTKDLADSCKVDFYLSFEFKSLLHSQLASVFFDEVAKQMVGAFEGRAAALYRNQQEASLRRRST